MEFNNGLSTGKEIQLYFDANWKSHEIFSSSIPCSLKQDDLACAIFIDTIENLQKHINAALKPVR